MHAKGMALFSLEYFAKRWHQITNVENLPRPSPAVESFQETSDEVETINLNKHGDEDGLLDDDKENDNMDNDDEDPPFHNGSCKTRQVTGTYGEIMCAAGEFAQLVQSSNAGLSVLGYIQAGIQCFYNSSDQECGQVDIHDIDDALANFARIFSHSFNPGCQDRTFGPGQMVLSQTRKESDSVKRTLGCVYGAQNKHTSRKRLKSSREVASCSSGTVQIPVCGFCKVRNHKQNKS